MDLQYRLPPFQQIFYSPAIGVSLLLLLVGIIVILYLSRRAKEKGRRENRLESLRTAEKILLKRGGCQDDMHRLLGIFNSYPKIDPAEIIMIRERFREKLTPLLVSAYGQHFADRMETLYFPPVREVHTAIKEKEEELKTAIEEGKTGPGTRSGPAILDLMDAILKPGLVVRLMFEGQEGGHECLVMGHDMQSISFTLPANNHHLIASLVPGLKVEGSLENGLSLLAFSSTVIQAVAGSMPYCRIGAWTSVWEVRKRDSIRLPLSLEMDFQHISTLAASSIKMANLDKEIGVLRPGHLTDVSLGGCCIDTPSEAVFNVGDMIRFSRSLLPGSPPVTLLGALVSVQRIEPEINEGSKQRLHAQFLIIDDVSQRLLVRALRHLQDLAEKDEWLQAQQLLQKMRRNQIQPMGSPAPVSSRDSGYYNDIVAPPRADSTRVGRTPGTTRRGTARPVQNPRRQSTRSLIRPPTRDLAKPSVRDAAKPPTREIAKPPTRETLKPPTQEAAKTPPREAPKPPTRSVPKPQPPPQQK